MNATNRRRRSANVTVVIAYSFAAALALSACATPSSSIVSASPTASSTKEASIFTKDVNVCFENKSPSPVALEWKSGLSTYAAAGNLAVGETACGEGTSPSVLVTFADTFRTLIHASNDNFMYPRFVFRGFSTYVHSVCADGVCTEKPGWKEYAAGFYAQGETVGSDVEGHHFAVTRKTDDDWVQFTVVIND